VQEITKETEKLLFGSVCEALGEKRAPHRMEGLAREKKAKGRDISRKTEALSKKVPKRARGAAQEWRNIIRKSEGKRYSVPTVQF